MYKVVARKETREVTRFPDESIICVHTEVVVMEKVLTGQPPRVMKLPNCVPMIGEGFIWFKTME